MMSPQVSVIIPVHNTKNYFDKCMESVLGQTFGAIEVILAENLSTDGSAEMCDGYARRDSRVRVLHLDKAGQSHARNAALTVARAMLVCFVDSDDYIEKNMLEELHSLLVEHDADMVCSNFVYESDGNVQANDDDDGKVLVLDKKQATEKFLSMEINNSPCTKLMKKSLFANLEFPEGRFYEDHAIMHRVAFGCDKVVWLRRSFYYYVQHAASTVHVITPKKQHDFFIADYGRYCFVENEKSLLGCDYVRLLNLEATRCFKHFRTFMRNRQSDADSEARADMVTKLSAMSGNKNLKNKIRTRLRIVKNTFWLFYFIHIAFRQK